MTLGSLFDGIGAFPLAASRHGITPVWASEVEDTPISITKRHFPHMKHLGDITKLNGAEIESVDIITFGSPCQDLSIAGKREGLDGKRSGLFMEAVRVIKEMREHTNGSYPRRIIWENVFGAFSSSGGKDFHTVIEEIAKIAQQDVSIPRPAQSEGWLSAGAVVGDGYSLAWRVLDAQYWGVPQRRRRIFLVADFGSERASEILFKPDGLCRDIAESGSQRQGNTRDVENGIEQYAVDFGRIADRIQMNAKTAVTLQGEGGGGGAKTGLYCIQGNTIGRSDNAGANGKGINEDVSFTLNTTDRHAVAYDCRNHQPYAEISGTLQAKESGGQSLNYINPVFTMQGFGDYKASDVASSLKSRDGKDSTDLITQQYAVRRLTPTECERLQGFPDGWTEHGIENPERYRKSIEKGKKRTGLPEKILLQKISDSARYKALGNSVAIPCVEFIMAFQI